MTGSLKLRNAIKDAISKSCIKIESEIEIRTKNNVQCLELKLEGKRRTRSERKKRREREEGGERKREREM